MPPSQCSAWKVESSLASVDKKDNSLWQSVMSSAAWSPSPAALIRLEVDEVWKSLGRYGRYQLLQIFTLLVAGLPMAIPVLSGVFEGVSNPHTCLVFAEILEKNHIDENDTVAQSCRMDRMINSTKGSEELVTQSCDAYDYKLPRPASFVSEWDLVCDRAALAHLSQTLVMAGMFVGACVMGSMADKLGRKWTHVGSHLALFAVSLAMAFVPNYGSFIATKFFVGVFHQGYLIPLAIATLELLPTEQRAAIGTISSLLWSISIMSMAPIAYLMREYSWRSLQIVFTACHAFCFVEIFVLDESLRWLMANLRFADINHVILKAARCNGRDPEEVISVALRKSDASRRKIGESTSRPEATAVMLSSIPEVVEEGCTDPVDDDPVKVEVENQKEEKDVIAYENFDESKEAWKEDKYHHENVLDLVKDRDMRFITLSMLYIWMTNSLTYYGVTLLSTSLAGNPYLNFFLGGLLEIPSNFVMWIGLARLGRKKTTIAFIALTGVSLLASSVTAATQMSGSNAAAAMAQTVLAMVARFGISGSFNSIWIYTPEVFPTNLRNLGLGISSSSARVGGMAAPFFNLLAEKAIWAPGAIFSVSCLLAAFLLTLLPETKHRHLPQAIADVKRWRREDRTSGKHKVGDRP